MGNSPSVISIAIYTESCQQPITPYIPMRHDLPYNISLHHHMHTSSTVTDLDIATLSQLARGISHTTPLQPAVHSHVYLFSLCTQVAAFLHGLSAHQSSRAPQCGPTRHNTTVHDKSDKIIFIQFILFKYLNIYTYIYIYKYIRLYILYILNTCNKYNILQWKSSAYECFLCDTS